MTNQASVVPGPNLPPTLEKEAIRQRFWQNLAAACVSLAWNAGFLFMSLALPVGRSRGDVGPGALPMQVSVFGLVVSVIYLVRVLRGADLGGSSEKIDVARVTGLLGLFVVAALCSNRIGLALCLGIGTGVATLLFPGEKPLARAVVTGAGFWLIAWGLFGKLLELALP